MARSPKAQPAQLMLGRHETFTLYDSLLFIGKPDLSPYGLKRSRTVYENELWPPKRPAIPNETAVRSKARAVLAEGVTAAVPVILDVEQYSVDVRLGRFAACINQAPMRRRTSRPWLRPYDIALNAAQTWGIRAIPPDHLLRDVFETYLRRSEAQSADDNNRASRYLYFDRVLPG